MIARSRAGRSRGERHSGSPATGPAAPPAPGSPPPVPTHFIARLVPLDAGFYAFTLVERTRWREPVTGFALPAIQVSTAPEQSAAIEITDSFGGSGSWLGGRHDMLFLRVPDGGSAALVTGYLSRDADSDPLKVQIRRLAASVAAGSDLAASAAAASVPPLTLTLGDPAAEQTPRVATVDVIAHIRSRGDVRFIDAPWVGRLGPGLWIESFTLLPRETAVTAALEYKGLIADGSETPWLDGGAPCGTQGRGTPLLGFAIRQKGAAAGARFDCEYSGYFRSGATVGPARNGAPCRSTTDNDPLEGMHVRITQRPARPLPPSPRSSRPT